MLCAPLLTATCDWHCFVADGLTRDCRAAADRSLPASPFVTVDLPNEDTARSVVSRLAMAHKVVRLVAAEESIGEVRIWCYAGLLLRSPGVLLNGVLVLMRDSVQMLDALRRSGPDLEPYMHVRAFFFFFFQSTPPPSISCLLACFVGWFVVRICVYPCERFDEV